MNKFGFSNKVCDSILIILRKYPSIKKAVIFGSRANNTYKTTSDIDIAIWCDNDSVDPKLRSDFEDSTIAYSIDVVNYNKIKNDKLRQDIDQNGISFYPVVK